MHDFVREHTSIRGCSELKRITPWLSCKNVPLASPLGALRKQIIGGTLFADGHCGKFTLRASPFSGTAVETHRFSARNTLRGRTRDPKRPPIFAHRTVHLPNSQASEPVPSCRFLIAPIALSFLLILPPLLLTASFTTSSAPSRSTRVLRC
jgi:hypothetical protein